MKIPLTPDYTFPCGKCLKFFNCHIVILLPDIHWAAIDISLFKWVAAYSFKDGWHVLVFCYYQCGRTPRPPYSVVEQDTLRFPKYLQIPRKRWLRPKMTEKLLTEALNKKKPKSMRYLSGGTMQDGVSEKLFRIFHFCLLCCCCIWPSTRCWGYTWPKLTVTAYSIWKLFLKYKWCPWNCKLQFHGLHS